MQPPMQDGSPSRQAVVLGAVHGETKSPSVPAPAGGVSGVIFLKWILENS